MKDCAEPCWDGTGQRGDTLGVRAPAEPGRWSPHPQDLRAELHLQRCLWHREAVGGSLIQSDGRLRGNVDTDTKGASTPSTDHAETGTKPGNALILDVYPPNQ